MSSRATGKIYRFVCCIAACVVGAIILLSLVLPEAEAWAVVRHRDADNARYYSQRQNEHYDVKFVISTCDFEYADEVSGAKLSHYSYTSSDGSSDSEAFSPPEIEGLYLREGEGCLHEEGSCEACDKLREMYRSGEIESLFCASIECDQSVDASFRLSVPVNKEPSSYRLFTCNDGELVEVDAKEKASSDNPVARTGSLDELQRPFGVAYFESSSQSYPGMEVHAYTPDEEEDDDPDFLGFIIGLLCFAGVVAALIVASRVLPRLWAKLWEGFKDILRKWDWL